MRLLKEFVHPDAAAVDGEIYVRKTARGIILRGSMILLLFSQKYRDYSFPGGGLEPEEDLAEGLIREVIEETGAGKITNIREFGYFDEFRLQHYPPYQRMRVISNYFTCEIDGLMNQPMLEDYEQRNVMSPVWTDIREAINHNRAILANTGVTRGFAIERETFVLERVAAELALDPEYK